MFPFPTLAFRFQPGGIDAVASTNKNAIGRTQILDPQSLGGEMQPDMVAREIAIILSELCSSQSGSVADPLRYPGLRQRRRFAHPVRRRATQHIAGRDRTFQSQHSEHIVLDQLRKLLQFH